MIYQNILFDLDGTLTDPALGITTSVAYALDAYGYKYESLDALKIFIGPPLREQFMKYCGVDYKKAETLVTKYREYYSVKGIYQNRVYDGIKPMLEALKNDGKRLIVATSKPEKFAKIILEHFSLIQYFDLCAGANMDNTRTDKAEVIKYALDSVGIFQKDKTVMVGDRMHDIIGAKKNGLYSIGVSFGYGSVAELLECKADVIADSPESLLAELKR